MRFTLAAAAVVAYFFSSAVVAQEITERCSTPDPPAALVAEARAQDDEDSVSREVFVWSPFTVNTYVHIVTTRAARNNFTQAQVNDQMVAMNEAYNPFNISFRLVATDFTVNNSWAQASYGSQAELDMKSTLRRGSYQDLNLYFLSNLGGGLLGFCYFPTTLDAGDDTLILDGCINLAGSLPGGNVRNYNLGGTAVHEAGHWFGLFHVFQGRSCDGRGDFVQDTPVQRNATSGCPTVNRPDSCPGKPGLDSIHNYMDYSWDICYEMFTAKQQKRMHKMFNRYRRSK